MYRILRKHSLLTHRRSSKPPQVSNNKLETIARASNQVWCWDITYLPSLVRGLYFKLYILEDIFSRKIIHHVIDEREDAQVAIYFLEEALRKEEITGKGLRLHNDNGQPMRQHLFLDKLRSLGVLPTCSRPRVSNDNPFIEALFKTLKYTPEYPTRPFKNMFEAKGWVDNFIKWYNEEHLHSGINYVTPNSRHEGRDVKILESRKLVFTKARRQNPQRWSKNVYSWPHIKEVELSANGCRITKKATSL